MNPRFLKLEYFLGGITILGTCSLIVYKATDLFTKSEILNADPTFFQPDTKFEQDDTNKSEETREEFTKSLNDYMKFFPDPGIVSWKNRKNEIKKITLERLSGISWGGWKQKGTRKFLNKNKYYEVKIWSKKQKSKTNPIKCRYTVKQIDKSNASPLGIKSIKIDKMLKSWKKICKYGDRKKKKTKSKS